MTTLRFIGMALLAVVLCTGFASCSDSEDNGTPADLSTLAGTTWKITSTDEIGIKGATFAFLADGTVTVKPSMWSKVNYTVSGSDLKIVFNNDDYIQGLVSINGNTATYRYKWYDIDGSVQDNGTQHNMTLQKQ